MKHINQKEPGKDIAILTGTELLNAIETQPSVRRKRTVTKEMVEERLNELVLDCLRSFGAALAPLGIESGGNLNMIVDFSRDPNELYDVLNAMQIGVAVKPRE